MLYTVICPYCGAQQKGLDLKETRSEERRVGKECS